MAESSDGSGAKEWYTHGVGLIVAILFLPFFVIWYAWAKSKWSQKTKIIVTAAIALFVILVLGSPSSTNKATQQTDKSPSKNQSTNSEIAKKEDKTEQKKGPKESVNENAFMDAMRKCTVMEGYDIHTTGFGAKSDNVFNDGREFCESTWRTDYEDNRDLFINTVEADWSDKKDLEVEGKTLSYYLSVLGW